MVHRKGSIPRGGCNAPGQSKPRIKAFSETAVKLRWVTPPQDLRSSDVMDNVVASSISAYNLHILVCKMDSEHE